METPFNLAIDVLTFTFYFDVGEPISNIEKGLMYYLDLNNEEGLKKCLCAFLLLPEIEFPENYFFDKVSLQMALDIRQRLIHLLVE